MTEPKPFTGPPWTVEEFDRWHASQPERWELISGVPIMTAQGSRSHTIIKGNVFAALRAKLAGTQSRVYVDGVEVKERSSRLSAVPNVVVERRPPDLSSPEVTRPVLLAEVLPPASERDDTGRKWQGYCLLPSLAHYLSVDQEKPFVTVHTRTGPASFAVEVIREGAVELTALGVTLTLDEIYEDVTSPEPEPPDA